MKKAGIYTRTGDCGTTSLACGTRVPKDHIRVNAYGTIDELNAHIGMLLVTVADTYFADTIEHITNNLLTIGSILATEKTGKCPLTNNDIETLEEEIDKLNAQLPPMRNFILPSGNEAAARANLCRTVCRRAERIIVSLQRETEIDHTIQIYINRLSDYFFLLQRQLLEGKEKIWEKPCK